MDQTFFHSLVGRWHLDGTVLDRPLEQEVSGRLVLGDRWLHLHFEPSTVTPLTDEPYEAIAFIGYDADDERFVMSLFDTFGADGWVAGRGDLEDGVVDFLFTYPKGDFRTRFTPVGDGWVIDQRRHTDDGWSTFGTKRLSPA